MGSGVYSGQSIVEADISHIDYLQDNLRDTDIRECIIHGATPFRALMAGFREEKAETYTVILDDKPAMMFGVTPIYEQMIGKIWALGTYSIENHSRKFLYWSRKVVDYFQNQYYQLENVVPADHARTIEWLTFLGFTIKEQPIMINGYQVLRFIRCKGDKILIKDKEQPVIS
jgi:hypothetical protein